MYLQRTERAGQQRDVFPRRQLKNNNIAEIEDHETSRTRTLIIALHEARSVGKATVYMPAHGRKHGTSSANRRIVAVGKDLASGCNL